MKKLFYVLIIGLALTMTACGSKKASAPEVNTDSVTVQVDTIKVQ